MPGDRCAHGPLCNKKHRGRNHRYTGSTGIPCAMVLRLIRALLGDHRLVATVISEMREHHRRLSACFGAPEPHDFAVRQLHHRRGAYAPDAASDHRIPSSTSVTTAKRPSYEDGTESRYSCFYPAVKLNSENQKFEGVRCLLSWAVIAARDRACAGSRRHSRGGRLPLRAIYRAPNE
jgi:hypothetical protein